MTFKVGDVVILKSGSPPMTVTAVEGDQVTCVWFEHVGTKNQKKSGTFPATTLKAMPPRRPLRVSFG